MSAWEELAEAEPMLRVVEAAAMHWAAEAAVTGDETMDMVWYRKLKPQLVRVVGATRELSRSPRSAPHGATTPEIAHSRADREDDEFLRTEQAYDVAYWHLYNVLDRESHRLDQ